MYVGHKQKQLSIIASVCILVPSPHPPQHTHTAEIYVQTFSLESTSLVSQVPRHSDAQGCSANRRLEFSSPEVATKFCVPCKENFRGGLCCLVSRHKFKYTYRLTVKYSGIMINLVTWKFIRNSFLDVFAKITNHPLQAIGRRGADKSLPFPVSYFLICSTTKRLFLGWVKEVITTKS
jgi:hypothetical protein